MERHIKLIWDFRGEDAKELARAYEEHLQSYPLADLDCKTGSSSLSSRHSIAYMVVPETYLTPVRHTLKPHRGEYQ